MKRKKVTKKVEITFIFFMYKFPDLIWQICFTVSGTESHGWKKHEPTKATVAFHRRLLCLLISTPWLVHMIDDHIVSLCFIRLGARKYRVCALAYNLFWAPFCWCVDWLCGDERICYSARRSVIFQRVVRLHWRFSRRNFLVRIRSGIRRRNFKRA